MKKETRLYCFSPLVMIVTFVIEISLAIYTFIKAKKAKSDYAVVLVLVFLALFQLSEYQICEGGNILFWSRIGMVSITFLPILGLYVVSQFKRAPLLKFAFLSAFAFIMFFAFYPQSVNDATCSGNYIIFNIDKNVHIMYGYYYFGFLLFGIWEALRGVQDEAQKEKVRHALKWFIIGYASFILPLTIAYFLIPTTRIAIASIMCGFAVVFAFILTFKIGPIYHECVKKEDK